MRTRLPTCLLLAVAALQAACRNDEGAATATLTVTATGLPDSGTALWLLETPEGATVRGGYLRPGEVDTLPVAPDQGYQLALAPYHAKVGGLARTWIADSALRPIAPLTAGGHHEVVAQYALGTGALTLSAVAPDGGRYYAVLTALPPLAPATIPTISDTVTHAIGIGDLPPGPYAVTWYPVQVQSAEVSGEFQNHHSHTYRAEPDTVAVTAALAPAVAVAEYTLRSGEFRISFTGLPAGLHVPYGLNRSDHGVVFTGNAITTPGLGSIISTEFLGSYTYSVGNVTADGVTYAPAPSATYQVVVGTVPLEIVIAYSPVP